MILHHLDQTNMIKSKNQITIKANLGKFMAESSKKRFMKLAGMTASIAGKTAKNSLKYFSSDEETRLAARSDLLKEVGVQIAETLGEMKGAVMKVGQIASQYKDMFPPEIATALEKLQKDAPPMPFDVIKRQVETGLQDTLENLFLQFEETPFAAASIGQVHRAILPTGESVVVKVQYPDVAKNCDSDLKQIRIALKLAGVLNMNRDLQDRIFTEIRQTLQDELDYQKEAKNLAEFAQFHQKDPQIIIPKVIQSHSSAQILTLTEETGETLATASTWDNAIKQKIARNLFHFSASQLFDLKCLHCDPHPGNFAFRPDGSIIAYDFGGIRRYQATEIALFRQLIRHAISGDIPNFEHDLNRLNIRRQDDKHIPPEFYQDWIRLALTPLSIPPHHTGEFDFAKSQIHHQIMKQLKQSLKYFNQFQPSATTLMAERTISGQYWNLVNLGVNVDLSPLVKHYIQD